jgi:hypothetical protein
MFRIELPTPDSTILLESSLVRKYDGAEDANGDKPLDLNKEGKAQRKYKTAQSYTVDGEKVSVLRTVKAPDVPGVEGWIMEKINLHDFVGLTYNSGSGTENGIAYSASHVSLASSTEKSEKAKPVNAPA